MEILQGPLPNKMPNNRAVRLIRKLPLCLLPWAINYKALQLNRYPGVCNKQTPVFIFFPRKNNIAPQENCNNIKWEKNNWRKNVWQKFCNFFLNTVLLFILMDTSVLFAYSTLTAYLVLKSSLVTFLLTLACWLFGLQEREKYEIIVDLQCNS